MKPVTEMTLEEMADECHGILAEFDTYAREGRCEGDMFWGWDWPTMNVIFPEKVARARELNAEYKRRIKGE